METVIRAKYSKIFNSALMDKEKKLTQAKQFLMDIAWETEVWTADNPDHIIHFDGEHFLTHITKGKPN